MINKKILLSGIKPTGEVHIGNYFGAMRQYLALQEEYESYIMIADLHALTSVNDPKKMQEGTLSLVATLIAIGLDPKKVILFKQSDITGHSELAWVFNCITTVPYLMRAHAYKDAQIKNKEINVGIFDYPILMASDILIYNADLVPVGQDQKQHLEIARDTAEKFNNIFGETFKLPEPLILNDVATVPGIDGQKMSKSYNNVIPLFASDQEIDSLVSKIITDSKAPSESKDPDTNNIFNIHKLLLNKDEIENLREKYKAGGLGYKEAKEILAKDLKKFITPIREKRNNLLKDKKKLLKILEKGSKKANKKASEKLREVKEKTGLSLS